MKFLLALSLAMFGCEGEMAETKGEITKITSEEEAKEAGVTVEYRYAKYKFIKAGYNDNNMAVRIRIDDNVPVILELKDLKKGREKRKVEVAELSKVDDKSNDTTYAFTGESVLPDEVDSSKDHGGIYTGVVVLDDGTVADDGCCGDMTFVPKTAKELTFAGRKQTPATGETFDKDWWEKVTTPPAAAPQYFYGNYTLSHDSTITDDDFDIALKLEVDGNGKATKLSVKKDSEDVVEVTLSESSDSFVGGDYTLKLAKNTDDEVTGIAELKYNDGTNDFTGTAGDSLSEQGWGALIGTCILEMSSWSYAQAPTTVDEVDGKQSLKRGVDAQFTVTLKCDNNIVDQGDNAALKVTLAKREADGGSYTKYSDTATYAHKNLEKGVATYSYNFGSGNKVDYRQFKATVTIDNHAISVEGDAFEVKADS